MRPTSHSFRVQHICPLTARLLGALLNSAKIRKNARKREQGRRDGDLLQMPNMQGRAAAALEASIAHAPG
jgi:hypothetical protein